MRRAALLIAMLAVLGVARELGSPAVAPRKAPVPAVARAEPVQTTKMGSRVVTRAIDGDTIELEDGQRVRYIGMDTPETKDPRKPVQCFGKAAALKNKELVEGHAVRLVRDVSDRDRYGRLLRYVYVGDTFVNLALVTQGFAKSYSYPPDIAHQAEFRAAERDAREHKRGLWAECAN